jgi:glycosyltransferase involved in cell wall biosynthesis
MNKNIGFVSTRFEGTDGVTLEAGKWADIFEENGHHVYWFAGKLDRDPETSFLVPEAFFHHPDNAWINERLIGHIGREAAVTEKIAAAKAYLKSKLLEFIKRFDIDLLIIENSLSIPMQVPLGIALTELIAETVIPCIAHHHDFFWERPRFALTAMGDYLRMAFPPKLPNIEHVVINTAAQEELALRTGLSSTIIPNIHDFENPPENSMDVAEDIRKTLNLKKTDKIILQPTRVVQRKGIEHAVELVQRLGNPEYKLVISHETGDEGFEYAEWLKENAMSHGVDLLFVPLKVNDRWRENKENEQGKLCLWDVYPQADFITYPSLYEGFGNAFLEAIYFKKPVLINRYAIFIKDIEPKGFDLIVMDGFLTKKNITDVREVLVDGKRRQQMVETNYQIAKHHYSYSVLETKLNALMMIFFGMDI